MNYKITNNEEFLNLIHKEIIRPFNYFTFGYQKDYAKIENASLGYIPFLNNFGFTVEKNIIPLTNPCNRCGIKKDKTLYIVVHDTASAAPSANADAHSNWLLSMANDPNSTHSVSWHFTVDENKIINHIPIDEVAYHAGDGTKIKLDFEDTNIPYNGTIDIKISEDGYYLVNNQKSNIKVPLREDGTICYNLPILGVNTKLSNNNTIMLGTTYYNATYDTVANKGGNLNSVGIETCVNYGSDYIKTMRITAFLVAQLLIHFDLDISSVKQHNSFSGKDCPMTIRKANLWDEFITLVRLNLYRMKDLKDAVVEFKSLSKDYLDDSGKVIKFENNKEIEYMVTIDNKEYIFKSILKGENDEKN